MDIARIDEIIDSFQAKESALILILMEIQHVNHWLPQEALQRVSERLAVPMSRVRQIASFYKTFSLVPTGRHEVHVCTGTSCHLRGAQRIVDTVEEVAGIKPGETSSDLKFSLETVNCLGCCSLGPVLTVDGQHHGKMAPATTVNLLENVD
ncbi:MAG: complex I 24 kDa subunit family protein [Deferrisomatales bacterium]